MAEDKDSKKDNITPTTENVSTGMRTDTKDAIKAAHDQAESDIEADVELTDISTPQEDLDEEESIKQGDDKTDIV